MFLIWDAAAARENVKRYERRADRVELKNVLQSINETSREGYTRIKWRGDIRKANIHALEKLGYKVRQITYCIYEISW